MVIEIRSKISLARFVYEDVVEECVAAIFGSPRERERELKNTSVQQLGILGLRWVGRWGGPLSLGV